jgi:hypothetical protein
MKTSIVWDLLLITKAAPALNRARNRAILAIGQVEDFLRRFDLPVSCFIPLKLPNGKVAARNGHGDRLRHFVGWGRGDSGHGALIVSSYTARGDLFQQQRLQSAPACIVIPALAALPALLKAAALALADENADAHEAMEANEPIIRDILANCPRQGDGNASMPPLAPIGTKTGPAKPIKRGRGPRQTKPQRR